MTIVICKGESSMTVWLKYISSLSHVCAWFWLQSFEERCNNPSKDFQEALKQVCLIYSWISALAPTDFTISASRICKIFFFLVIYFICLLIWYDTRPYRGRNNSVLAKSRVLICLLTLIRKMVHRVCSWFLVQSIKLYFWVLWLHKHI